jgi:small Trp-rich protein
MPLAIICVIVTALWFLDVGLVGRLEWWWIAALWGLLFFWWEVLSKWVGWDKRAAEKRMRDEEAMAKETKRKNRGF